MDLSVTPALKRRRFARLESATTLARPFKTPRRASRDVDVRSTSGNDLGSSDPAENHVAKQTSEADLTANSHEYHHNLYHGTKAGGDDIQSDTTKRMESQSKSIQMDETASYGDVRRLRQTIKSVRGEIDILERAIAAIEESDHDNRLEILISRWKQASQNAVDALFPIVKARVEGQGGMAALRREKMACPATDSAQESKQSVDENIPAQSSALKPSAAEKEDELEESFDIPAMLKLLHIDLSAIGYDEVEQRWSA